MRCLSLNDILAKQGAYIQRDISSACNYSLNRTLNDGALCWYPIQGSGHEGVTSGLRCLFLSVRVVNISRVDHAACSLLRTIERIRGGVRNTCETSTPTQTVRGTNVVPQAPNRPFSSGL